MQFFWGQDGIIIATDNVCHLIQSEWALEELFNAVDGYKKLQEENKEIEKVFGGED